MTPGARDPGKAAEGCDGRLAQPRRRSSRQGFQADGVPRVRARTTRGRHGHPVSYEAGAPTCTLTAVNMLSARGGDRSEHALHVT